MTPTHLAYIPSKLLALKCSISTSKDRSLLCENKHAHVTLGFAQGKGKNVRPKHSNDLLEACDYAKMFDGKVEEIVQQKLNLEIGQPGKKVFAYEVYVMKVKEKDCVLNGQTQLVY